MICSLWIIESVNDFIIQGRLALNENCNLDDGTKLCSRIKITWAEIGILESHTTYLGHVLERYKIYKFPNYIF